MLGVYLKKMRTESAISQGKLAKLLVDNNVVGTCTKQYISALENKQFTNYTLFYKIAGLLDYDIKLTINHKGQ